MNPSQLYKLWAPESSIWSNWAKPVLFAEMTIGSAEAPPPDPTFPPSDTPPAPPNLNWAPAADSNTAIVLDIPGAQAVKLSVELIKSGFRPVPLFNGVRGPQMYSLVNVDDIIFALYGASDALVATPLPDAAPPVFLLDSERFAGASFATPGRFDNRWYVFPQDFPSANFLLSRSIRSVILAQRRSAGPQSDLSHVLLRWQEAGIQIQACGVEDGTSPSPITISRPENFRSLWYRAMVLAGLRRNSAGGFGAVIPEPSSSGGYG
jgi:hypothetical protein